jgi:hypothetical protein
MLCIGDLRPRHPLHSAEEDKCGGRRRQWCPPPRGQWWDERPRSLVGACPAPPPRRAGLHHRLQHRGQRALVAARHDRPLPGDGIHRCVLHVLVGGENDSRLLRAAVLLFIAWILKCIDKPMALKSASIYTLITSSSFQSNSTVLHNTLNQRYYGEEGRSGSGKKNYLLLSGPPCVLTGRSGCHHAAHKLPAPMARSVVAAGGRGAS